MKHLVGVGVLAYANARPGAITESSLLYFTRFGIKMQMLTSAFPQSPKRVSQKQKEKKLCFSHDVGGF